jgi:DNA repair exonuclease SbcCD ATPase subunit
MSFFNKLSKNGMMDDEEEETTTEEPDSKRLSTGTNVSTEISDYQAAIEDVLTKLLAAEEVLSKELKDAEDLGTARTNFHEHEDFMLKLSEYQIAVGSALETGSKLLTDDIQNANLSIDEQNEIKQQLFLLNERWENLRLKALDFQSQCHKNLAELQNEKVDELRNFLTATEDRISKMPEQASNLEELLKIRNEHRTLRKDLENQQKLVESLSNLVIIEDSEHFENLEDKLSALEERWRHVILWSDNREKEIEKTCSDFVKLFEYFSVVSDWINSREFSLKVMEASTVDTLEGAIDRMHILKYCDKDLKKLQQSSHLLESMLETMSNNPLIDTERIVEQVENINDKVDAMTNILNVQQARIESMGFHIKKTNFMEIPKNWEDFAFKLKALDKKTIYDIDLVPQSIKKRRLEPSKEEIESLEITKDLLSFIQSFEGKLNNLAEIDIFDRVVYLDELNKELTKRVEKWPDVKGKLTHKAEFGNLIDLSSKYDEFAKTIRKQCEIAKVDIKRRSFYDNLTKFKLELAEIRDWFKSSSGNSDEEELQKRLEKMETLTAEISNMQDTIDGEQGPEWQELKVEFDQFMESWSDLRNATERLIEEKSGIQNAVESYDKLQKFMDEAYNAEIVSSSPDQMAENLEHLTMQKKIFKNLISAFDDICERCPKKIDKEFSDKWHKTHAVLCQKIVQQNTKIENLKHFEDEVEQLEKLLQEIDESFKQDIFIIGEIDELKKKSVEYEEHAKKIKKADIDLISLKNFADMACEDTNDSFKKVFVESLAKASEKLETVQTNFNGNLTKLKDVISQTEEILKKLNDTEVWLDKIAENAPKSTIADISNVNELFQLKSKFQTLKEEIEQNTTSFHQLNELGTEVLLTNDELVVGDRSSQKISYLAKKFTKLNAKYNVITSNIFEKTSLLEHISNSFGELETFKHSENGYLEKLEKKLRKSPENSFSDLEELSEELDDIENFLKNHSEDRIEKMKDISRELIDLGFSKDSIRNEVCLILERWEKLQNQANQRIVMLETAVAKAQMSEMHINELQQWIYKVDELLNDFIDNDTTIQDVPHDFQRLSEEFKINEEVLNQMKQQVEIYKEEGKIEAANRFRDQIDLLEERFHICVEKLDKLTSPQAIYESRLNHAMAELRNVERNSCVLDINSAGTQNIYDQHLHCLKMYRTLSDVKSDIENVIKTGRKICEEPNTKNPDKLGQRIDTLKYLYNSLGENVTKSKIVLENLMKILNQFNLKIESVLRWTSKAKKQQACLEKSEEINAELEKSKIDAEQDLKECHDLFQEYSKVVEPVYIEDLKEKLNCIDNEFTDIVQGDTMKVLMEMKEILGNMENLTEEKLKSMEEELKNLKPTSEKTEKLHAELLELLNVSIVFIFEISITVFGFHFAQKISC